MNSYQKILHRLFNVNLFGGIKLDLQNMHRMQKLLEYPDNDFKVIHVAGTNGKGSVVIKIAAALEKAGYRTGMFTSPHISSFRERIRINGELISEENVIFHLSKIFDLIDKHSIPATFFEITTLLAMSYFSEQKVDAAILEVGLGGRLDATNIVKPILSIITSISLDHTDVLGNTIEEIAIEKGGIIKPQVPVLIGFRVPNKQIIKICHTNKSPFTQIQQTAPTFEKENTLIAKRALELLSTHFKINSEAYSVGLQKEQPCRFEIVHGTPTIILDVAHNPDGLNALFKRIEESFPNRSLRILFGLSKNKDIEGCLKLILEKGSHFHLIEAPNGRGLPVNELLKLCLMMGADHSVLFPHQNIQEGVFESSSQANQHDEILIICGSFFIMKDVRQSLGFNEPVDLCELNEMNGAIKKRVDS